VLENSGSASEQCAEKEKEIDCEEYRTNLKVFFFGLANDRNKKWRISEVFSAARQRSEPKGSVSFLLFNFVPPHFTQLTRLGIPPWFLLLPSPLFTHHRLDRRGRCRRLILHSTTAATLRLHLLLVV
jgi:hypothetical protein